MKVATFRNVISRIYGTLSVDRQWSIWTGHVENHYFRVSQGRRPEACVPVHCGPRQNFRYNQNFVRCAYLCGPPTTCAQSMQPAIVNRYLTPTSGIDVSHVAKQPESVLAKVNFIHYFCLKLSVDFV